MNLQSLSIIFIIIAIPIMIVTSYYIGLQSDTLKTQILYDRKLLSSASDGINAYEINTVEWNEGLPSTAEAKRINVMAAINTFISSFADNIGMSGASKDTLLPYIPAVAFTTYDGFYIYSPSETKTVIKNEDNVAVRMTEKIGNNAEIINNYSFNKDDAGKLLYEYDKNIAKNNPDGVYKEKEFTFDAGDAKTIENSYTHILKPFIPYAAKYTKRDRDIDVVINYTLDNYIRVYGKIGTDTVSKAGYLAIGGIEASNNPENLTEIVAWRKEDEQTYTIDEYSYVYSEGKEKVYFDSNGKPFTVNANNIRYDLENRTGVTYKKIATGIENGEVTYVYQALCGEEKGIVYNNKNDNNGNGMNIPIESDYSSNNYYFETEAFNVWFNNNNLGELEASNMQLDSNVNNSEINTNLGKIFNDYSVFNQHKQEVMKQSIINNLNQAITSYSRNSDKEYKLPMLKETDWDQVFRNVSLIAFVQDIPIGMKYYNNYAISTSSKNKDFVDPDGIYISAIESSDEYYHKCYCDKIIEGTGMIGYRNTDYSVSSYINGNDKKTDTVYYYRHFKLANQSCYYCLVEPNLFSSVSEDTDKGKAYKYAYNNALSRERYVSHEFK